jgi:hypothetical protein
VKFTEKPNILRIILSKQTRNIPKNRRISNFKIGSWREMK